MSWLSFHLFIHYDIAMGTRGLRIFSLSDFSQNEKEIHVSISLYIVAFPLNSVKCSDQCQALWPGAPVTLLAENYLMF